MKEIKNYDEDMHTGVNNDIDYTSDRMFKSSYSNDNNNYMKNENKTDDINGPNQSYGKNQDYRQYNNQNQDYGQNQDYRQYNNQNQGYGQNQDYRQYSNQNQGYGQNQDYRQYNNQNQGYGQNQDYRRYNNQNPGYGQNQYYGQYNNQSQWNAQYNGQSNPNRSQCKNKIVAGLLGIFLGVFGVHNFYLGYTGRAVTQLLLTIFTFGMGAFITSIWSFVEGILILTGAISVDANGNPIID